MPPTGGNACCAGQVAGGGKGPKVKERINGAKQQLKLQTEDGQGYPELEKICCGSLLSDCARATDLDGYD